MTKCSQGRTGEHKVSQKGRSLGVKREGSEPALTNQLQGQDTMWHCPLDIVVASGCVIISGKKVGLRRGKNLFLHPRGLLHFLPALKSIVFFHFSILLRGFFFLSLIL